MSLTDQERRERKTAAQRKRRKRKSKQAAYWAKRMQMMPEHIRKAIASGKGNIPVDSCLADREQRHSWETAPRHLQDRTSKDGGFDDLAVDKFARAGGKSRGEDLTYLASDRPSDLQCKYNHLRGRRGAAKIIASLETEAGRPISERHVRRLMKK